MPSPPSRRLTVVDCGIFGVFKHTGSAAVEIYEGLLMLQHRGQDSAGIVCYDGQRFRERKVRRAAVARRSVARVACSPTMFACPCRVAQDNGLVKDVFDKASMKQLGDGSLGLGHVRYPTAGSSTAQEAQPFFVNSPLGIYLVCLLGRRLCQPASGRAFEL